MLFYLYYIGIQLQAVALFARNGDDQFDGTAQFFAGLGDAHLNATGEGGLQQGPPVGRRGPGLYGMLDVHEMFVERGAGCLEVTEEDAYGHVELLMGEKICGNAFVADHRNEDALHGLQVGSRMQAGDIGIEPAGVRDVEGEVAAGFFFGDVLVFLHTV